MALGEHLPPFGLALDVLMDSLMIEVKETVMVQADGWIWRDTVIWAKKSAMPESVNGWRWEQCRVKVRSAQHTTGQADMNDPEMRVSVSEAIHDGDAAQWSPCPGCPKCADTDGLVLRKGSWRCTSAHEYIFVLTKGMGYYADAEAVKTKLAADSYARDQRGYNGTMYSRTRQGNIGDARTTGVDGGSIDPNGANRRSVWNDISPEPYGGKVCPECGRSFKPRVYNKFPKHEGHPICPRCEEPLQSHFATFPSDLPRICIQASTSERGCCPDCGSQWARVVEKEKVGTWHDHSENLSQGSRQNGEGPANDYPGAKTLGWRPTWGCVGNYKAVPALVLDPFAGTATACLAAQKLGRRAVGVDLSEAYLQQAVKRLEGVPLPLGI